MEMDHNRFLIDLLQKAELKAKMSLYYLKESGHNNIEVEEQLNREDVNELYNSTQMYCKTLEKQLKEKNGEIKKVKLASDEISRHNEAMLEEISHLNHKLQMYPMTIKDLKAEIDKLSEKVRKLEEQKKHMEQQAAQNEARLQQSQSVQQDLIQSQAYIHRLKKYLDSSSCSDKATSPPPVLLLDKTTQTSPCNLVYDNQVQLTLNDQSQKITQLRDDLIALKTYCSELTDFNDDIDKLKELVKSGAHEFSKKENSFQDQEESNSTVDLTNQTSIPIHYLLNVERVEIIGRVLSPDTETSLTTYTNNTNNTDLIVNDNNNISTFSLDLVIPMNAPQQQLSWLVTRLCRRVKEERSVLVVMLGHSDLTLYGTPQCHGLLRHLLKSLLSLKKKEEELTLSIGTFVNNQMCDGLSEFSLQDGKVSAVSIVDIDQGVELLSQADIPDETDEVLHQFTLRSNDEKAVSVSILECESVDNDSCELLYGYRACGKLSTGSRPNVLYDTVNAYTEKRAAVTVFLNLKPDMKFTADNMRLLKYTSRISGLEPVTQTRKKGFFSFRN